MRLSFFITINLIVVSQVQILRIFLIWRYIKKYKKLISLNYNFKKRGIRQKRELEYVENGSIYIFKAELIINNNNRIGGKFDIFNMKFWQSFELDEKDDWKLLETLNKVYILKK